MWFKVFENIQRFDRHLDRSTAKLPVKFQSDRMIIKSDLAASKLWREIWQ